MDKEYVRSVFDVLLDLLAFISIFACVPMIREIHMVGARQ